MALSEQTRSALERERREILAKRTPMLNEIAGLKDKRDALIVIGQGLLARVAEIDADLVL